MIDRIRFYYNRLTERLWVRPLAMCLFSIAAAFLAKGFEGTALARWAPTFEPDSIEKLLTILSGGMLVIATFAVGSMVAAYSSAANQATPRTFALIVSDGASQNALSIFVGAFIFSLVSLLFYGNGFYTEKGESALLGITVLVIAVVILTFVRWVDSIARLGLLGTIIRKAETKTSEGLTERRNAPTLGCAPVVGADDGWAVLGDSVGWVQQVATADLQDLASRYGLRVRVHAIAGDFAGPGGTLATVRAEGGGDARAHADAVRAAFRVGDRRTFDEDPRFGLVVLSEVAGKALSPGINDPGTAIEVIGAHVRLLSEWAGPPDTDADRSPIVHDRVEMPELSVEGMFEDAFVTIARDGAGTVEVMVRLLEALVSLATLACPRVRAAARDHALQALARAEAAMDHPEDLHRVREAAGVGSG
ncbi:MAG: DUF2254 domain-containing protein [Phycisphaerales bacterium]|nr:DUF2254 domain-containing protein [Planctomycetota bacterium]MCH8507989.1 DUF2254 domain-containing protein [Phycisphaerales bacterium]